MGSSEQQTRMAGSEVVVLYSGGSDSTLTAVLEAAKAERVHLLTFGRHGIFNVENTRLNVDRLRNACSGAQFEHHILDVDPLFRWLSYDNYLDNVRRHGLMLLSTCGLCKLSMHLRTLLYCLEHGVHRVADGANHQMNIYPAQMSPVLDRLRAMYAHFGIEYGNPVYDFDGPSEMGVHPSPADQAPTQGGRSAMKDGTTDHRLWELGILDEPSTKGSQADFQMQARCFQFVLFRLWVHWVYLPKHGYDRYVEETTAFYDERIGQLVQELERWRANPEESSITALLVQAGGAP